MFSRRLIVYIKSDDILPIPSVKFIPSLEYISLISVQNTSFDLNVQDDEKLWPIRAAFFAGLSIFEKSPKNYKMCLLSRTFNGYELFWYFLYTFI